jgi:D-3-phosphoglycerate dehydrogenase
MAYKVLIVEDITEPGKKLLRENGYEIKISLDTSIDGLRRDIADCDAALSKTVLLTREVLESAKKLKVIGKHGAGVDNVVDVEVATNLGIRVVNTPYANTKSVAEYTIGLIIALAKNLIRMNAAMEKGDFGIGERLQSSELSEKTLGLIGLGKIGNLVAQKAHHGLEMKVIAYDPYVSKARLSDYVDLIDDIDEVFKKSDFVSLHLPSTKETVNLIDYQKFLKMKPDACFINCARGNIVKETDLIRALENKTIAGAAVDVYELEPPQPDNPLLLMPNVIHTPHSAALSKEALDRMSYGAALGIHEVLSGKSPTWGVNELLSP